jgi:ribosomal protein S18 acetylase RimI-like enzyme
VRSTIAAARGSARDGETVDPWRLHWIERTDAEALARARAFAAAKVLDRVALAAALEQPGLAERARMLEVTRGGRVCALAAEVAVPGAEPIAFLDASLPGAAARALPALARPIRVIALEPIWPELARGGGAVLEERVQLARLDRSPLPERDPRVVRRDGPCAGDAAGSLVLGGPSFAVVDDEGGVAACAGVGLVADAVAQIASLHTREGFRRRGLARAVLVEAVRALEEKGRRVVAEIRSDDVGAIRLFASLGFRGRARVRTIRLGAS